MQEARKCRERGRLVRIGSDEGYSRFEDNQRFFALRAQCGRDVRVPSNQLIDFLGKPIKLSPKCYWFDLCLNPHLDHRRSRLYDQ